MNKITKMIIIFVIIFLALLLINQVQAVNEKTTKMYLETPSNKVERVITELNIGGWVMSEENIQIKVYVNDNFIKDIRRTERRQDVLDAIQGFGGKEKNPLPGFNDIIDVSDYEPGIYNLRIEIISLDTMNKVEETQIQFEISQYTAKSYIDMPYNKQLITSNELTLSGWVMSEGKIKIKAYIDDNYVQDIERNVEREDVINAIKGYGTRNENPLPGFDTKLDISSLEDGEHTLKIEVIRANNGNPIHTETNTFKKDESMICLESPSNINDRITTNLDVGGWIMTNDDVEIKIYINDEIIKTIERTVEREDVLNTINGYGGKEKNPLPGFDTKIDISNYKSGIYSLKIEVINKSNSKKIEEINRDFKISTPNTKADIDKPYSNEIITVNELTLSGWVMSEADIQIKAYIDDIYVSDIVRENAREDVLTAITDCGTIKENPLPGFTTNLDIKALEEGEHTAKIEVIHSQNGDSIYSKTITFRKDRAIMCLEAPTTTNKITTNLNVGGWLLSDENVEINIYINDTFIKTVNRNVERNDVLSAINGYGGKEKNPLPGFNTQVDVSNYKSGTYNLKVEVINVENSEKIEEANNQFKISLPNTKIDIDSFYDKQNIIGRELTLGGWAMSETDVQIKAYIDDVFIKEIERTIEREDVLNAIKGYGTEQQNPLPGFTTTTDMIEYADGLHTVKLEVISTKTDEVVQTLKKQFILKKYDAKLEIDNPLFNTVEYDVTVSGWLMSQYENTEINIYINDTKINTPIQREQREDVLNAIQGYGTSKENPLPGYKANLDMSSYKDGTYTLKVEAINKDTLEPLTYKTRSMKLVKYNGNIHLETPTLSTLSKEELIIGGWELSKCPDTTLNVYLDNTKLDIQRKERPDVFTANNIKNYGGVELNPTPGFEVTVDFTQYSDGDHTIKIVLVNNKTGETVASMTKNLMKYSNVKLGIDVSSYQRNINWVEVANSGVDFAMIRAGFRGYGVASDGTSGKLVQDDYYRANMEGAISNGIDVGVYFFTQAINEEEAVEEANFVLNLVRNYKITYPIAIDTEASSHPTGQGRADNLTVEQRTNVIKAFCETIRNAGYEPMIYASKSWLRNKLDMSQLQNYSVWLAHYTGANQNDPLAKPSDYEDKYIMWQYTSSGTVDGILGNVDMNVGYNTRRARSNKMIQIIY